MKAWEIWSYQPSGWPAAHPAIIVSHPAGPMDGFKAPARQTACSVKAHLIPPEVTPAQVAITYANEADLLNVALFGQTARQWRDTNPALEGNMREYATVEQLSGGRSLAPVLAFLFPKASR